VQGAVNFWPQVYGDLEFARYGYCLSHALIIFHLLCLWKALHPAPPSSLPTRGQGFQAGRLL
jgi:hypothetical protein